MHIRSGQACVQKKLVKKIKMFVSHVYLGINVFEINIEREGKEKLASFSTIMTGNVDSSL